MLKVDCYLIGVWVVVSVTWRSGDCESVVVRATRSLHWCGVGGGVTPFRLNLCVS